VCVCVSVCECVCVCVSVQFIGTLCKQVCVWTDRQYTPSTTQLPKACSGWIPRTYFIKCNKVDRRWKIIIFMTHLFHARKASLASRVPSFCGIDIPSGACYSTDLLIHCKRASRGLLHGKSSVVSNLVFIN
jgi:hypothetical protein